MLAHQAEFMEFTHFHICCGIGGWAKGFQKAKAEYGGKVGRLRLLGGVDSDPLACEDFTRITGVPAIRLDLFTYKDYIAFHGHKPPANWREATPYDIFCAAGKEYPDIVCISSPCKGFTGLISEATANSPKYQALNHLFLRTVELTLIAFNENLPSVILMENVPRITTRGKHLLKEVRALFKKYGYVMDGHPHDCGEIGGLGQHRKRYLLISRNVSKMPAIIYQPPKQRVKAIGEVIGLISSPDDPAMGPLHRLPNLQWKTWVRIALIPAGKDWRYLKTINPEQYRIQHEPRGCGPYGVQKYDEPASTVIGNARIGGSNAAAVADPSVNFKEGTHQAIYRVVKWDEPGKTVTGAFRPNNGAMCIPDPRIKADKGKHPGVYRVVKYDEPGPCVTGTRFGSGAPAIADPELGCSPRSGTMGVNRWDEPAKTVTSGDIHSAATAVADPRIPKDNERGAYMIIAEDGTWHRPLTTLELAVLQSLSPIMADGSPLILAGNSDARWREAIGNMVPPDAAQAIGGQILPSLMASKMGEWFLGMTGIWVLPQIAPLEEMMEVGL